MFVKCQWVVPFAADDTIYMAYFVSELFPFSDEWIGNNSSRRQNKKPMDKWISRVSRCFRITRIRTISGVYKSSTSTAWHVWSMCCSFFLSFNIVLKYKQTNRYIEYRIVLIVPSRYWYLATPFVPVILFPHSTTQTFNIGNTIDCIVFWWKWTPRRFQNID